MFPLAVRVADLCRRIIARAQWPVQWKGGRQLELFKGKGSASKPDNYRGLLISDHLGKAFLQVIKREMEPLYRSNQPKSQHGSITGRGSDFAHQLRRYFSLVGLCVVC